MIISLFLACETQPKELPIMGTKEITDTDTVYHTIPNFAFYNQDSVLVTNETFAGKNYVADFFFTSCPTICPKVKQQMLRIHEKYKSIPEVELLSYTIDPKRDTVGKLKRYADNLGVTSEKWHFVTGEKDAIYGLSDDYYSIVIEDADVPGGFDHSGYLILVDENRHIRSIVNGTDPEEVDKMLDHIDWLLAEQVE